MARLERYVDNVNGNDSWDGTSPVYQGGTVGPWASAEKACTTAPGTGNYFVVYFANNNNLKNKLIYPYRRKTDSHVFYMRYGGLSLAEPMEFHLNGAWFSGGIQVTGAWEKVPGTSYVYRLHLPSVSSIGYIYAWGDDAYRGLNKAPLRFESLSNIPPDSANHAFYWDSANKMLYICDWSGNPNATGLYIERDDVSQLVKCYSGSVKYHRFINGTFFNCKNSIIANSYEGLFFERCYLYADNGYDNCLNLPINSAVQYSVLFGRSSGSSTNAVIYVSGSGVNVHNNFLYGSNYGIRLAAGATCTAYNNIICGQSICGIKYDGPYGLGLTADYNAFGVLELDRTYGNCIGQLPAANDIFSFPGQNYGLFAKAWRYDGSSYTDITDAIANDDESTFNLMGASSHYIYLGSNKPFMGLLLKLTNPGLYSDLAIQYYAGSSGWLPVSGLRGQTALNTTGCVLAFNMPSNWVKTSVNNSEPLYWIRISAATVTTIAVGSYCRINGSLWEFSAWDRDSYDLRSRDAFLAKKRGYNWGSRKLDLAGNQINQYNCIGPYLMPTKNKKSIELELAIS